MSIRSNLLVALVAALCILASPGSAQDLASAQKLLEAKKYEEACTAFEALLDQENVDQFEVRLGLGTAYYWWGDPETGTFHAARAQGMKPDHLGVTEILARCLLASGDLKREAQSDPTGLYEQALGEFDKLTKAGSKSAEVWSLRGTCLYWLSRPEEAAKSYARAAELEPENPIHPYWAAFCFQQAQKLPEAIAQGAKALKAAPKDAKGGYEFFLAKLQHESGAEAAAAESYVGALASGQLAEADATTAAAGLYTCYAGNQDWNGLSEKVSVWLKKQPNDGLGLWWGGYVQGLNGKPKEALALWQRLEKASRRYAPEALYYQGVCHQQLGDDDAARAAFVKAAKLPYDGWNDQKDPVLQLHGIAGGFFSSGQFEEACRIAEGVALPVASGVRRVNLLSDLGLFHRDWGSNLEARGKKAEAKKHYVKSKDYYETAVKEMVEYGAIANPQRAQIQNDYALMFQYHFDDNETAVENYKIALGYDKTNTDACLNYGRVLLRQGKAEEALVIARQGLPRGDLNALIAQIERSLKGN